MTATAADQQAAPNTPAGTPASPADSYSQTDWNSAYGNVTTELEGWVESIEGTIPPELQGTLYRNGPGRLERGGQWVHHPFDGDGMVLAVGFRQGRAYVRNRFVRTAAWLEEEAAGRWCYRGVFGTQKPGGILANALDLRLKNIANTNVIDWGGHLLALWEAALPTSLDPVTLATQGPSTMGGVLGPQDAFSAHPRLDPGHNGAPRLVNFRLKAGPRSTIRLMEFDPQGQLTYQRQDRFQGFAFLHDFALTPNWAVFLRNALEFNPLPYVMGRRGAAQCLRSRPGGRGEFWLIPRHAGAPVILPATEGFVFHHVNAWEEGASLVVDSIHYADFPMVDPAEDFRHVAFDQLPPGQLERCTIDLIHGHMERRRLSGRCCEFATVHPRRQGQRHRHVWMAVAQRETGNAPLQAIEKLDVDTGQRRVWSAAPRGFVSEPVLAPHPHHAAEDAGWILSLVWNGARRASDVVILRAADLQPQAVLHLPLAIPHGLHGTWSTRDITPTAP